MLPTLVSRGPPGGAGTGDIQPRERSDKPG